MCSTLHIHSTTNMYTHSHMMQVYALPMRWTLSSIVKSEFIDAEFGGAELSDSDPRGFVCEDDKHVCYGRTGYQAGLIPCFACVYCRNDTCVAGSIRVLQERYVCCHEV